MLTRHITVLIQIMLTIITSIVAIYTDDVFRYFHNYDEYFFCIFLYLGLSQIRQMWIPQRWTKLCFAIELLYSLFLIYAFSTMLVFLFIATWITSPKLWDCSYLLKWLIASWLGLQIAFINISWTETIHFNVVTIVIGILLFGLRQYAGEKKRLMLQNDELRQQIYELQQSKLDMIHYARAIEEMSQAEERSRIAHDLHDELGHQFIRLKMMMDASVEISATNQEQAFTLFFEVRSQLAACMELMRSTVKRLKPADHRLHSYSLERLQQEYESAKFTVDYHVEGIPYVLYPSVEIALYRNAREALTNAIRHGGASKASIIVHYEPSQVVLHVSNNGQLPSEPIQKGMGMRGMQDRAHTLGGNIEIITTPLFRIQTKLPIRNKYID
ncbi:sensor histidine kinase [Paenibacillus sp. SC116]|uniref:sensor histidine kinase n=1 Tax=Paenibacillus sp. SC116 TaxID=2968986 RepID=UPI00215B72F8|nr:sensor histidine kinase [Paenibacillus sp. SC116]MCR8844232.1 sensor histidine kinase [Paenibacillus sp. SC116]